MTTIRRAFADTRLVVVEGALAVSVVSIVLRTRFGVGPGTGTLPAISFLVLLLAAPSFIVVAVTRWWRIWPYECLLSSPWLLIGVVGDTSCVDCGFVFLVPLILAAPQLLLVALAVASTRWRPPGSS